MGQSQSASLLSSTTQSHQRSPSSPVASPIPPPSSSSKKPLFKFGTIGSFPTHRAFIPFKHRKSSAGPIRHRPPTSEYTPDSLQSSFRPTNPVLPFTTFPTSAPPHPEQHESTTHVGRRRSPHRISTSPRQPPLVEESEPGLDQSASHCLAVSSPQSNTTQKAQHVVGQPVGLSLVGGDAFPMHASASYTTYGRHPSPLLFAPIHPPPNPNLDPSTPAPDRKPQPSLEAFKTDTSLTNDPQVALDLDGWRSVWEDRREWSDRDDRQSSEYHHRVALPRFSFSSTEYSITGVAHANNSSDSDNAAANPSLFPASALQSSGFSYVASQTGTSDLGQNPSLSADSFDEEHRRLAPVLGILPPAANDAADDASNRGLPCQDSCCGAEQPPSQQDGISVSKESRAEPDALETIQPCYSLSIKAYDVYMDDLVTNKTLPPISRTQNLMDKLRGRSSSRQAVASVASSVPFHLSNAHETTAPSSSSPPPPPPLGPRFRRNIVSHTRANADLVHLLPATLPTLQVEDAFASGSNKLGERNDREQEASTTSRRQSFASAMSSLSNSSNTSLPSSLNQIQQGQGQHVISTSPPTNLQTTDLAVGQVKPASKLETLTTVSNTRANVYSNVLIPDLLPQDDMEPSQTKRPDPADQGETSTGYGNKTKESSGLRIWPRSKLSISRIKKVSEGLDDSGTDSGSRRWPSSQKEVLSADQAERRKHTDKSQSTTLPVQTPTLLNFSSCSESTASSFTSLARPQPPTLKPPPRKSKRAVATATPIPTNLESLPAPTGPSCRTMAKDLGIADSNHRDSALLQAQAMSAPSSQAMLTQGVGKSSLEKTFGVRHDRGDDANARITQSRVDSPATSPMVGGPRRSSCATFDAATTQAVLSRGDSEQGHLMPIQPFSNSENVKDGVDPDIETDLPVGVGLPPNETIPLSLSPFHDGRAFQREGGSRVVSPPLAPAGLSFDEMLASVEPRQLAIDETSARQVAVEEKGAKGGKAPFADTAVQASLAALRALESPGRDLRTIWARQRMLGERDESGSLAASTGQVFAPLSADRDGSLKSFTTGPRSRRRSAPYLSRSSDEKSWSGQSHRRASERSRHGKQSRKGLHHTNQASSLFSSNAFGYTSGSISETDSTALFVLQKRLLNRHDGVSSSLETDVRPSTHSRSRKNKRMAESLLRQDSLPAKVNPREPFLASKEPKLDGNVYDDDAITNDASATLQPKVQCAQHTWEETITHPVKETLERDAQGLDYGSGQAKNMPANAERCRPSFAETSTSFIRDRPKAAFKPNTGLHRNKEVNDDLANKETALIELDEAEKKVYAKAAEYKLAEKAYDESLQRAHPSSSQTRQQHRLPQLSKKNDSTLVCDDGTTLPVQGRRRKSSLYEAFDMHRCSLGGRRSDRRDTNENAPVSVRRDKATRPRPSKQGYSGEDIRAWQIGLEIALTAKTPLVQAIQQRC